MGCSYKIDGSKVFSVQLDIIYVALHITINTMGAYAIQVTETNKFSLRVRVSLFIFCVRVHSLESSVVEIVLSHFNVGEYN